MGYKPINMTRFKPTTEDHDKAVENILADVNSSIDYYTGGLEYSNEKENGEKLRDLLIRSSGDGIISYGCRYDYGGYQSSIHMICCNVSGDFKLVRIFLDKGKWEAVEDVKWSDLKGVLDYITCNWL